MAIWIDLKLGQGDDPKPLAELHIPDAESLAQTMPMIQGLLKGFGLG